MLNCPSEIAARHILLLFLSVGKIYVGHSGRFSQKKGHKLFVTDFKKEKLQINLIIQNFVILYVKSFFRRMV